MTKICVKCGRESGVEYDIYPGKKAVTVHGFAAHSNMMHTK